MSPNFNIYYRPIPFWSWNDNLNIEALECQIQEMKKAGLGGYLFDKVSNKITCMNLNDFKMKINMNDSITIYKVRHISDTGSMSIK